MRGGIQVLRLCAALGVVALHFSFYGAKYGVLPATIFPYLQIGGSGVTVFFVLSGFLMAMSLEKASVATFIVHRALRIYPAYWAATALSFTVRVSTNTPALDPALTNFNWIPVLSLAPMGHVAFPHSGLGIEWTLVYEVFFYALVALLIPVPPLIRKGLVAVWLLAILRWGTPETFPTFSQIPLSLYNIAFIVGMSAWWLRAYIPIKGVIAFLITTLAFLGNFYGSSGMYSSWAGPYAVTSCLSAAFILIAWRSNISGASLIARLGDGSYGLYLLHVSILTVSYHLLQAMPWLAVPVALFLAISLGLMFGVIEFRLYRHVSSFILSPTRRAKVETNA